MNKEDVKQEISERIDEYLKIKKQYEEYRKNNPILDMVTVDYIKSQNDFIIKLLSFYMIKGDDLNEF